MEILGLCKATQLGDAAKEIIALDDSLAVLTVGRRDHDSSGPVGPSTQPHTQTIEQYEACNSQA